MLKHLSIEDKFKTAPSSRVFWLVLDIKQYPAPAYAGFPTQIETKILAESQTSFHRKEFIGSNLAVYIEVKE